MFMITINYYFRNNIVRICLGSLRYFIFTCYIVIIHLFFDKFKFFFFYDALRTGCITIECFYGLHYFGVFLMILTFAAPCFCFWQIKKFISWKNFCYIYCFWHSFFVIFIFYANAYCSFDHVKSLQCLDIAFLFLSLVSVLLSYICTPGNIIITIAGLGYYTILFEYVGEILRFIDPVSIEDKKLIAEYEEFLEYKKKKIKK